MTKNENEIMFQKSVEVDKLAREVSDGKNKEYNAFVELVNNFDISALKDVE